MGRAVRPLALLTFPLTSAIDLSKVNPFLDAWTAIFFVTAML